MAEKVLALLGGACLLGWLHFAAQYYPPGYGYAEERRNMQISMALGIAGLAFIGGSVSLATGLL